MREDTVESESLNKAVVKNNALELLEEDQLDLEQVVRVKVAQGDVVGSIETSHVALQEEI